MHDEEALSVLVCSLYQIQGGQSCLQDYWIRCAVDLAR